MMRKKAVDKNTAHLLADVMIEEKNQPHELPPNWIWVPIGKVAKVVSGGTPSTSVKEYFENGDIGWITPADLSKYDSIYISRGERNITKMGLENSSARVIKKNSILLSSRAPIGYVAIANNELCTNQGFKNFEPTAAFIPHYGYWYLKASKGLIESMASGTTFTEISGRKAAQIPIPIPPLLEQKRIVEKLESMLGKLKEARELIQEARDTFEKRRAAILHQAFTGELTKKWRGNKASKNRMTWKTVKLQDVTHSISDGDHQAPPKATQGIPFILISNIKNNEVEFNNTKFVPVSYFNNLKDFRKPRAGDILYTVTGSYGIPVLIKTKQKFCFQRHIALLRPNDRVSNKFLFYILNSQFVYQQAMKVATGTAQLTVPLSGLRNFEIPYPSLEEQNKIVSILNNILNFENEAKKLIDLEEQISMLEKSILSKAFRGELCTNDPNDEAASALLELTRAAREAEAKKPKGKRMQHYKSSKKASTRRPLLTVLKENGGQMTPEELFQASGYSEELVDRFFAELRELTDSPAKVVEERNVSGKPLLKVVL